MCLHFRNHYFSTHKHPCLALEKYCTNSLTSTEAVHAEQLCFLESLHINMSASKLTVHQNEKKFNLSLLHITFRLASNYLQSKYNFAKNQEKMCVW